MENYTSLEITIDGHVATLTMDSPPVNALTRVLNGELTHALDRISETEHAKEAQLAFKEKRKPAFTDR